MKFEQLSEMIMNYKNGTFHSVEWERPCKTKKSCKDTITKHCVASVRFGVQYDNISAVQEKRESGELPSENAGLPWGRWLAYPYFIEHKGNNYLRCSVNNASKVKTVYLLDGKTVQLSDIASMLLASELKESEKVDVFNLNVENILTVK